MGRKTDKFEDLSHGESTEQWLDKIEVKTAQGFAGHPLPKRQSPRQMHDVVKRQDANYSVDDDDLPVITPPEDNLGQAFRAFRKELGARLKYLGKVTKTVLGYLRGELKQVHAKHPKFASMMGLLVLAPVVLIGAGIIASQQRREPQETALGTTIPTTFVESANIELYYPTDLPEGFVIKTSEDASIISQDVVTYTVSNADTTITFNHQFDIPRDAIKQLVGDTAPIETPAGQAYIITEEDGSVSRAILSTESVTILINSNSSVDKQLMRQLVVSMKKN